MRRKLENKKNKNIINTSTGSYISYRENILIITKQRTPSFIKRDDSSSETHTAIQPKRLLRCQKNTNNDLIDTDISTSTYDNIYIIKSLKYHYNSDSSFILSTNSSSSSINKQQHNSKDKNSTKIRQTSKIHNKKERRSYTKHQIKFKKYVDKYIATRGKIKPIATSRCRSPQAYNIMNPTSTIKTKKMHRHQCTHTEKNNNQFEGNSEHMNSNVAAQISFKSSPDIRH